MKRLSTPSGGVADNSPKDTDSADSIVRPAILVHSAPDGKAMRFMSGDGPIDFDEARIKRVVANQNRKLSELAQGYGGVDKMPSGAWTPILDQHADDSNNRVVGRYNSLLRFEKRDVPGVGKNVACAVADIKFLGKDTVDRVKDGRIYHLSIGIDEKTDTLGETSTVIEPAAPGAMLLNRGRSAKTTERGVKMSDKLKRMKAHTERMAKLSAMRETIKTGSTQLAKSSEMVRLERREGAVTHRLQKLISGGRMTPAEYKNLDVKRLAKLDDESLGIALSVFDARERPVIEPGQRGSTDAPAASDLARDLEKRQLKHLRAETRTELKRLSGGKVKLKSDADGYEEPKEMSGPKEEIVQPGKDEHVVPGQGGDEAQLKHMHGELKKHLEAGDIDKAKEMHDKIMAHCAKHGMKHMEVGDVKSEDSMKHMDDVQKQVDELSTQMARMAGMVDELMAAEKDEGHELEADDADGPGAAAAS